MQKPNSEMTVMMAIPAELLEEIGIGPFDTVQLHVSHGRLIMEPVDDGCRCRRCCRQCHEDWEDD